MGRKIILCRCVLGGYDLCADCGGSGVIIKHGKDDYRPLRNILPSDNKEVPKSLSVLAQKIQKQVLFDDSLISFFTTNFSKLRFGKRINIIQLLHERVEEWKVNISKITDETLREQVYYYIKELKGKIKILEEYAPEPRRKKTKRRKK